MTAYSRCVHCSLYSSTQPNSPSRVIREILEDLEKTNQVVRFILCVLPYLDLIPFSSLQLARRIFGSFAQPGSDYLLVNDIARYFRTLDEAEKVFALFDKDSNGDASQEEIEMACLYVPLFAPVLSFLVRLRGLRD